MLLIEDYRLVVEMKFVCPSDLDSYAGGRVSSW
jgi:hypothetical protein